MVDRMHEKLARVVAVAVACQARRTPLVKSPQINHNVEIS